MSGQVALLAEAEAIGKLAKAGFKPRRTLIYASWDGEEPGLLGSTEWVETHADELKAKAVLYVNSDMNQRGELMAGGSHALAHFVSEAARDVKDPETGVVVLTRALALKRVTEAEDPRNDASGTEAKLPERGDDLTLVALGSGSDYTPFLQHLGVSSIDLAFRGEAQYGVYHSAYDSFDHFRRFVDPDFQYAAALAKLAGRLMLRAAQADLLPARERDFADSIGSYVEELHKLADAMRKKTRIVSELAEDGAYRLASDPTQPRSPPARLAEVPHLDFTALDNATDRLKGAARAFDGAYTQAVAADGADGTAARARLNAVLAGIEQKLTDPRGLPGRSWYQHMIYAPGMSTGYGVKTLPGIREAIEERRWDEANQYAGVVARTLDAYSAELERALASPH
jgi:N-acetylated-alpha-linked acidic dipeptidase